MSKRQKVKSLSNERARKLQASLAWQQFSRDSDEVRVIESVLKKCGQGSGCGQSQCIFRSERGVYLGNRHP